MRRRKLLATFGGLTGISGVLGTGAFSSVRAARTVSVAVTTDRSAYLGLEPTSPFATHTGGTLTLQFDETEAGGQGVGPDSAYRFTDVFQVTNQGTQARDLIQEGGAETEGIKLVIYNGDDPIQLPVPSTFDGEFLVIPTFSPGESAKLDVALYTDETVAVDDTITVDVTLRMFGYDP